MTKYEESRPVLLNFKTTRGWRDAARLKAKNRGMNLSQYLRFLVENDL